MAKLYGDIDSKNILTLDKSFARANGQPLDSTEVWYDLDKLKDYAKTDVAYIGQQLIYIDENSVVHNYVIKDIEGNLEETSFIGTPDDTKDSNTINGTRKYTDAQIAKTTNVLVNLVQVAEAEELGYSILKINLQANS